MFIYVWPGRRTLDKFLGKLEKHAPYGAECGAAKRKGVASLQFKKKLTHMLRTSLCRNVAQSVQLRVLPASPSAPLGPLKVLVALVRNGAVEWQLRVLQITFHRPPGDRLKRH